MAPPKGNDYWKLRELKGAPRKYIPEQILKAANEYFSFCIDNPLQEEIIVPKQWKDEKGVVHPYMKVEHNKMRAFTITGLCNWMNIVLTTWKRMKDDDAYCNIITRVEQIIYSQKFEGSAAGLLNPNIIARDLGLNDKQDINVNYPQKMFSREHPKGLEIPELSDN